MTVIRYYERGVTCGSCRAHAAHAVLINGEMYATACARHLAVWKRRADQAENVDSASRRS